jgi:hypothetical protein
MTSHIRRFVRRIIRLLTADLIRKSETNTLLLSQLHIDRIKNAERFSTLADTEFRAFSQFGEDGIIQHLIHSIPILENSFLEFGVENYTEANTRFLLINDQWRGLVLDGSEHNIEYIQKDDLYWRHDITAKCLFVTRVNINEILSSSGFVGDIGLLSIDIDGNEYWVWDAIDVVTPRIVICEYNSIFGAEHAVTIPYDEKFDRSEAHYTQLYFGVSLAALCSLAEQKEYDFVGCNSAGVNAFFIRKDLKHDLPTFSATEGFVQSSVLQSRDSAGNLSFLSGNDRIDCIKDLPLHNIKTNKLIKMGDIVE